MKGERGAALITTLLISMIVIAVSMLVGSIVRGKIGIAREMKDGLQAAVNAENLLQESLFVLSTHRFSGSGITVSDEDVSRDWHFDNRSISSRWGTLTIQDPSGLFPLWPFYAEQMKRLLASHGIRESDAHVFIDSLLDWMDADDLRHLNGAEQLAYRKMGARYGPRNDYWQSIGELRLVHGMTSDIWSVLEREVAPSVKYGINPLTMRDSLLGIVLGVDEGRLDRMVELKGRGELNATRFRILFPEFDESMDISFFPSASLIICATGFKGDATCKKEMTVRFAERLSTPFRIENMRFVQGSRE